MIEQGPVADETLITACADILKRLDIEAFGERRLHWMMPPELIERYILPDMEQRMFGYPVLMEALLGESTIVLMEALASTVLPKPP